MNIMSANIETIAWTNQTPWHGLGVKVEKTLTVPQMLNKAKNQLDRFKTSIACIVDEQQRRRTYV